MENEALEIGDSFNRKVNNPTNQNFISDCSIDTDMEILIPSEYITNITERLMLYRELDDSKNEEELIEFEKRLRDRFGPIPKQVTELIHTIRLRWLAMEVGFEKLLLKNNKLVGYFIPKQDSPYYQSEAFTNVLKFFQQNQRVCKMKESNGKLTLTFENIKSIDEAINSLKPIVVI
jgi:transcription-repair coupling factor (superfamily II helicase)